LPLSHYDRIQLFGKFGFTRAPQPGNPEKVILTEPWINQNLMTANIRQLDRTCRVHRLIRAQFLALWDAWEAAGLIELVRTFDGSWVSRFKRQTGTYEERVEKCKQLGPAALSNHTWGTAFDINAPWNPLYGEPAPVEMVGSVLRLVPLAQEHGFAWGGNFHSRKDGMHFEAYKILK
jgi:hypothetical protein